jgi:hypothetical protein
MSGSNGCMGCKVAGWISTIVYALVTLITLYAAYNTHFLPDGTFIAGAPEGSLALLTVIFSFHMFMKSLKKLCPCGGCCGSSCGGCPCGVANCNCPVDGSKAPVMKK